MEDRVMGHPVAHLQTALPDITQITLRSGRELTIRGLLRTDLGQLAHIYSDAYNQYQSGEHWTSEEARRLLSELYSRNPGLSLVAEIEGGVVGAAMGDTRPWCQGTKLLDINEIFVGLDYQSMGIGARLFNELLFRAEKWAKSNMVELVTFGDPEMEHPRSWYEKLGFQEVRGPRLIVMDASAEEVIRNLRSKEC